MDARKHDLSALEKQRPRPACTPAQSNITVHFLESMINNLAARKMSIF